MISVTILGNNSALPAHGRHPTAQIVQIGNEQFLVDCGEGTQIRLADLGIRKSKITRIFISHLHGDHYFGLIGLITSMNLMNRENELHIYGPSDIEKIIQMHLDVANSTLCFTIYFHLVPLNASEIYISDQVSVSSFPVYHRIPCWGYIFKEVKPPRKLLPEQAASFEIPIGFYKHLIQGLDYTNASGEIVLNSLVTTNHSPVASYAFCADTKFDIRVAEAIAGIHTIYHESTFLDPDSELAEKRFHSTAAQAAKIAQLAGAQQLLLGHFSSRYVCLKAFEEEAKAIFSNSHLALEGVSFMVK